MADRPHVLVLGGTAEAVALANAAAPHFDVTYSLAGRTQSPSLPDNVTVRTGGFGGIAALSAWLLKRDIDLVVDSFKFISADIYWPMHRLMQMPKSSGQWRLIDTCGSIYSWINEISRDMFTHELVVWQVFIKGAYHVVPIPPSIGNRIVKLVTTCFRVTHQIKPMACPSLTEIFGSKVLFYKRIPRNVGRIVFKRFNIFTLGWQSC